MAMFRVTAFENVDTDFFHGYKPGDHLKKVGAFTVEAASAETAPEALWPVGNRMSSDVNAVAWPTHCRSMSLGDVVEVDGVRYAVASFGWEVV